MFKNTKPAFQNKQYKGAKIGKLQNTHDKKTFSYTIFNTIYFPISGG